MGEVYRWLVPVMGCFLLAVSTVGPRPSQLNYLAGMRATNLLATMGLGNQGYASYTTASYHSEANSIPFTKMQTTYGPQSAPEPAFARVATNNLKR